MMTQQFTNIRTALGVKSNEASENPILNKRGQQPLIGIPTWSDRSQAYSCVAIYAMNRLYLEAITQAGGLPILIPLDLDENGLEMIFEQLDGLFLAGGEDIAPQHYTPSAQVQNNSESLEPFDALDRDATELTLTRWALATGLPILGICRGMQLINVASGGTLYQDLGDQRPDLCKHDYFSADFARDHISHPVELASGSYLADLFGSCIDVNSLHHQGIDQVGSGLEVVAWSPNGLPEAIQLATNESVLGVQWHPEALCNVDQRHGNIFRYFVEQTSMQ